MHFSGRRARRHGSCVSSPAYFYAKSDPDKTPLVTKDGWGNTELVTLLEDCEKAHPEPRRPEECEYVPAQRSADEHSKVHQSNSAEI